MFLTASSRARINAFRLAGLGIVLSLTVSCGTDRQKEIDAVARVGDTYLSRQELQAMMPSGLMPIDSIELASKKISAWISQQVLLQKAIENIDGQTEEEIEQQIGQYRQTLMIFRYENMITAQLLDTLVSAAQIEEYYKSHPEQFVLKSNIVRVRFVKIDRSAKKLPEIRKELFSKKEEEKDLYVLADLCKEYAENYFLDGDRWLFFSDLLREVPIKTYNQEEFLRNHRHIEVASGTQLYLVEILDFKVRDMVSPISFEKDRIKAIILNQRKKQILNEMENDLLKEAENSGSVEVY